MVESVCAAGVVGCVGGGGGGEDGGGGLVEFEWYVLPQIQGTTSVLFRFTKITKRAGLGMEVFVRDEDEGLIQREKLAARLTTGHSNCVDPHSDKHDCVFEMR